ncbi:TetR/AcrR family transcriptional regulator [Agromyces bauzanensis]
MTAETTRPARKRGRPRKEDEPVSNEQIFVAALHAFAVYGYEGVSLRTLNAQLGVSHNVLHQRCGSKADLWRAAVDHGFGGLIEEIVATDDDTRDPLQRLRGIIREFVLANARRPDLLRLVNAEGSQRTERLDYLYENYLVMMETVIRPIVDDLVAQGRIRAVPWRTLFFLITSGGVAIFSNEGLAGLIDDTDPQQPNRLREHADVVADIIVSGLSPNPPA